MSGTGSFHHGGMNVAHYNTAVLFLSTMLSEEELKQMLGQ